MNKTYIYILVAVLAILPFVMEQIFRNRQNKSIQKLLDALKNRNFTEFDTLADSDEMKKMIPAYNLNMLKISSYQMRKDRLKAKEMFDQMKEIHLSKAQEEDYALKGFISSVISRDVKECAYFKSRIEKLKLADEQKNAINRMYEIVEKNDPTELAELNTELNHFKDKNPVIKIWMQ